MAQISKRNLSKQVAEKVTHIFLETLVRVKSEQMARIILEEMLTPTERVMLSKRLAIMYLLEKGYDYRSIKNVLKVSTTTVSRISLIRQTHTQGLRSMMMSLLGEEQIKHFFETLDVAMTNLIPPKGRGWKKKSVRPEAF